MAFPWQTVSWTFWRDAMNLQNRNRPHRELCADSIAVCTCICFRRFQYMPGVLDPFSSNLHYSRQPVILQRQFDTMDHSGMMMDTAGGAEDFCTGTGRVMLPGFQKSINGGTCVLFLFQDAVLDTEAKYALAVTGTFFIAVLVEMFRWFRTHVGKREFRFSQNFGELAMDSVLFLLYTSQMCLAYFLMLLVMLYEYILFIAILIGLGTGLIITRHLDLNLFPNNAACASSGTPCCDGGTTSMVGSYR